MHLQYARKVSTTRSTRYCIAFLALTAACGGDAAPQPRDASTPPDTLVTTQDANTDTRPATVDDAQADTPRDAAIPVIDARDATSLAPSDAWSPNEITTMVSLADGTELWTWVVLPAVTPAPALMERTPYTSEGTIAALQETGRYFASEGIAFVLQAVRGRGRSTGTFLPFTNEAADGSASAMWISRQTWSNGNVGTIGGSYDGFTAIAASHDNPVVKVVIADDPADDERSTFEGGALRTSLISWLSIVETGELPDDNFVARATNAVDLLNLDQMLLGHRDEYWRRVMGLRSSAPYPVPGTLDGTYSRVCTPTFVVYSTQTGWHDPIRVWNGLTTSSCAASRPLHRLVLTRDSHVYHLGEFGTSDTVVNRFMFSFIDRYLRNNASAPVSARRVLFATGVAPTSLEGADQYEGSTLQTYWLGAGAAPTNGSLATTRPATAGRMEISNDPSMTDPCSDEIQYAYFTTDAFTTDRTLRGTPVIELDLASTTPDVDIQVDLYESRSDGFEHLAVGRQRASFRAGDSTAPTNLTPGQRFHVRIPFTPAVHRVRTGNVLQVLIGTAACGFHENPNTGEPYDGQTRQIANRLSVLHGGANDTRLVVPFEE